MEHNPVGKFSVPGLPKSTKIGVFVILVPKSILNKFPEKPSFVKQCHSLFSKNNTKSCGLVKVPPRFPRSTTVGVFDKLVPKSNRTKSEAAPKPPTKKPYQFPPVFIISNPFAAVGIKPPKSPKLTAKGTLAKLFVKSYLITSRVPLVLTTKTKYFPLSFAITMDEGAFKPVPATILLPVGM